MSDPISDRISDRLAAEAGTRRIIDVIFDRLAERGRWVARYDDDGPTPAVRAAAELDLILELDGHRYRVRGRADLLADDRE